LNSLRCLLKQERRPRNERSGRDASPFVSFVSLLYTLVPPCVDLSFPTVYSFGRSLILSFDPIHFPTTPPSGLSSITMQLISILLAQFFLNLTKNPHSCRSSHYPSHGSHMYPKNPANCYICEAISARSEIREACYRRKCSERRVRRRRILLQPRCHSIQQSTLVTVDAVRLLHISFVATTFTNGLSLHLMH
jgi:hypothetical protein